MEKRFDVENAMRQHLAVSPMALSERLRRDYGPGCVGAAEYGIIRTFSSGGRCTAWSERRLKGCWIGWKAGCSLTSAGAAPRARHRLEAEVQ